MKAKKFLAMLMVGATVFSLTACGGSKQEAPKKEEAPKQEQTQAEAPASPAVTIQIGYENNPGEPLDIACNEWKRLIEEKSNGTMTVELFPSSQLGSKTDLMDQMQMGEGVITLCEGSFWADYGAPELGIMSVLRTCMTAGISAGNWWRATGMPSSALFCRNRASMC